MGMLDILFSKKFLFFINDNGHIKQYRVFKETDNLIETYDGKSICKDDNHAYISTKGFRYFFVRNTQAKTSANILKDEEENPLDGETTKLYDGIPYKKPELDREAMYKIHHSNLLKSMHSVADNSLVMTLAFLAIGFGIGYVFNDVYGNNEVFNNQNYNDNYFQGEPKDNETIIIGMINIKAKDTIDIMEGLTFLNYQTKNIIPI